MKYRFGMSGRGWGRVLTIGSINRVKPHAQLANYAATKSTWYKLAMNPARQYADPGVTINNPAPGVTEKNRNASIRFYSKQSRKHQKASVLKGRAGPLGGVVGAALLVCSDAGSFITGTNLCVTGGGHLS